MSEENEDDIRRKKLEQQKKTADAREAEDKLKVTLRVVLEPSAYNRLMNVRLANQQIYIAAAQYVLSAYKRFGRVINEHELLNILQAIKTQGEEKTGSIRFERK